MVQAALAKVVDVQEEPDISDFRRDVIQGLEGETKSLSPKYFYDERGSKFFDEICDLEEYYPYRTELKLLPRVARELCEYFLKPVSIVEFGAGSLVKIRPLLEVMHSVVEFIPIDISGDHLFHAANKLQQSFPEVRVNPAQADFCHHVNLQRFRGDRLGFFPGSTIGNFKPTEAQSFLQSALKTLGHGSFMLIGVDTKKSPELLHDAYNDKKGVTAKFNLNILERINRELGGDIDLNKFEHYAYYNPSRGRIEMHLVSTSDQVVKIGTDRIRFNGGETIHTECSYKYSPVEFKSLAEQSGWQVEKTWMADRNMFSMYLLRAQA